MLIKEELARVILGGLRAQDVEILDGLNPSQFVAIEDALGAQLPEDLNILLANGVPIGNYDQGEFPNWHNDPKKIIKEDCEYIEHAFRFDIEENNYWHELLGAKPNNLAAAFKQALNIIKTWPPLIRVYGHRFLPTMPSTPGNPVISLVQPTDSVIYGNNLLDYFEKEFGINLSSNGPKSDLKIPYWGEALELEY